MALINMVIEDSLDQTNLQPQVDDTCGKDEANSKEVIEPETSPKQEKNKKNKKRKKSYTLPNPENLGLYDPVVLRSSNILFVLIRSQLKSESLVDGKQKEAT
ncbi:hypothetical protein ACLB2K_004842 [Fragaria x ananassa]